jgi:hypothetical protein
MRRINRELLDHPPPPIRCQCVVDLINRFERPFRFRVEVLGVDPPFRTSRVYDIVANTDQLAAQQGMELFCKQVTEPKPMLEIVKPTVWY